jgi:hypothetical protein
MFTTVMGSNGKEQSPLVASAISLGLVLTFIGSIGLILTVGVGESVTVVFDPDNATADSNATFGSDISIPDRLVMVGAVVSLLGPIGFGVISTKTGGPAVGRIIRLMPLALGFVGAIEFSDIVLEMVQGDYIWGAGSAGADWLAVFITGATVGGIATAFGMKANGR